MKWNGCAVWAALAVAVAGCSSDTPVGVCSTNQDCAFNQNCVSGQCVAGPTGCTSDVTCAVGEQCNLQTGQCERVGTVSCARDTDCPIGERCSASALVCVAGNRPCVSDITCIDIGQICDLNVQECVDCYDDSQCPGVQTCENKVCVGNDSPQCRSDIECAPPTTICEDEVCTPGCSASNPCPLDLTCNTGTGRCEEPDVDCAFDVDCDPPNTVCEAAACLPGCSLPGGVLCGVGETCEVTTGRCVIDTGCISDSDCNPPSTVCEALQCEPGCGESGCSSGQVCSSSTGRCEAIVSAPLSAPCFQDSDCASGLCFDFGGSFGSRCIQSCGSNTDCPIGFGCLDYLGGKACVSAALFQNSSFVSANGLNCSIGGTCQSAVCLQGQCVGTCDSNADCVGGAGCYWELVGRTYVAACTGPRSGTEVSGAPCSFDAQCRSGVCYSTGGGSGRCAQLCGKSSHCRSTEICEPVDYSECGVLGCRSVQLTKACIEGNPGPQPMGGSCADNADCRDGICLDQQCVGACSTNADCPTGLKCALVQYSAIEYAPGFSQDVYSNYCFP